VLSNTVVAVAFVVVTVVAVVSVVVVLVVTVAVGRLHALHSTGQFESKSNGKKFVGFSQNNKPTEAVHTSGSSSPLHFCCVVVVEVVVTEVEVGVVVLLLCGQRSQSNKQSRLT
jgi:hypothetical protein